MKLFLNRNSVEYDFVPSKLSISTRDLIHIQWAGSNSHTNEAPGGDGQTGDDGQGKSGTDRTNFVQISSPDENFPLPYEAAYLWDSVETVWTGHFNIKNKDDLALFLATGGYYECNKGKGQKYWRFQNFLF